MSEAAAQPSTAARARTWLVAACDVVFSLGVPVFLSIYWAWAFQAAGGQGYPWAFPAWSYSVTFIKMAAFIVWAILTFFPKRPSPLVAGVFGGVFLVGGGHALACGAANMMALGPAVGFHVLLAHATAFAYLRNSVRALLMGKVSQGRLAFGFSLGVLCVVALAGTAELLLGASRG